MFAKKEKKKRTPSQKYWLGVLLLILLIFFVVTDKSKYFYRCRYRFPLPISRGHSFCVSSTTHERDCSFNLYLDFTYTHVVYPDHKRLVVHS